MRPIPRMVRAILDRHGLVYQTRIGGKHEKLTVTANGQKVTLVVAISPSDHRALMNQYIQTRQKLTAIGVNWQECKDLVRD